MKRSSLTLLLPLFLLLTGMVVTVQGITPGKPAETMIEKEQAVDRRTNRSSWKKELKVRIKTWKKDRKKRRDLGEPKSERGFLVILVVLGMLCAATLVGGIAFAIAYNGSSALAIFILLFGLAGVIILGISLIKKIIRKAREEKAKAREPQTN